MNPILHQMPTSSRTVLIIVCLPQLLAPARPRQAGETHGFQLGAADGQGIHDGTGGTHP